MDNELILFDRVNVIKDTIKKYGEENFYISFSGGKDSTVLHHLVDMAIPGNKIPRLYINTGIEYNYIVEFVKELQKTDDRIVIVQPGVNIKKTLKEKGYPFKSKEHANWVDIYQRNKKNIDEQIEIINRNPKLKFDYEHIHNLPRGTKAIVKYYFGLRERERAVQVFFVALTSLNISLKKMFRSRLVTIAA